MRWAEMLEMLLLRLIVLGVAGAAAWAVAEELTAPRVQSVPTAEAPWDPGEGEDAADLVAEYLGSSTSDLGGPMRFEVLGGNGALPVLLGIGRFEPGTAALFWSALSGDGGGARHLALVSGGGLVPAALELGSAVRASSMRTIVPEDGTCHSACTLVLAAGLDRLIGPEASVGVHQMSFRDSAEAEEEDEDEAGDAFDADAFENAAAHTQFLLARVITYLTTMGVSPDVVTRGLSVPADDIYPLSEAELIETRLATYLM